jgi:uncharacterized protein
MSDRFDRSIVMSTAHRPWPMPTAPWLMTQSWHDLLFAHWRVDTSQLRRAVPDFFELDLFDGEAWVGVVPFYMTNVGLRAAPALPWLSAFPELNVRTYVRVSDRPGVYFFSLDAGRRLAVAAARALLNLPYYAAAMRVDRPDSAVHYQSARRSGGAEFHAIYEAAGTPFTASVGSIEYFLTERYCLYHYDRRGRPTALRFTTGRGRSRSHARRSPQTRWPPGATWRSSATPRCCTSRGVKMWLRGRRTGYPTDIIAVCGTSPSTATR